MPKINVSDSLYNQIESAAQEDDVESALWEMVYRHKRPNDPAE